MNKEIVIYDYTIRFGNKILYDVEEDIIKLTRLLQKENKELQKENQSLRTRIKTIKRRRKHQTQKLNKYKTVVTDLRNALEKKNNKIDKAIDVIHTQMKNNPSYKENLKIIENNLIKGSCKVCDLKDSDVDE